MIAGTQGVFLDEWGISSIMSYGGACDRCVPWGMVFTNAGPFPRHPSQLYEPSWKGLFFLLPCGYWEAYYDLRPRHSSFLFGYAVFRFIVEFFREADSQLGYYLGGLLTMGQILCILQMLLGIEFSSCQEKVPLNLPWLGIV